MEAPIHKFRFHVMSLPHTVTTPEFSACAYTMKVLKFCKMMYNRGHYILHYGHEDSIVQCHEKVDLITNDDFEKTYGNHNWKKEFFKFDSNDYCHQKFNSLAIIELLKRIQKGDFVLIFWGQGHWKIADIISKDGRAFVVEPGIGYTNSFCKYRIFESYAVAHHTYGLQNNHNPSFYHCIVPNYFDVGEFEFKPEKQDYCLFLGRISTCKGVHIIIDATKRTNNKLVIAGQGDLKLNVGYAETPEHVEYVGYAGIEKRKNLMANAKCLIIMSDYVEPFGGVVVEAMLSGTPVITPDWGAFVETVLHGITGYRVRTMEQLVWAINNIHKIDPKICRQWAEDNYSLETISKRYEEYFYQLSNLWKEGWYEENPNRTELDWLNVKYPDTRHPVNTSELQ